MYSFFIRTDGQLRFTDGELVYHRYRNLRWTRFLGATLCPCNNANYLIHERFAHLPIVYSFSPSVPTATVPTVPMDKVWRATLCPCNNANYLIHERILHIYRSIVPTDNFDLPMENWFTIGTDRTDGQGFGGYLMPLQ